MLHLICLSCLALSPIDHRKLVFVDDFRKEKSIDLTRWVFDDGPVYNHELEKYTSGEGENAYIKDGCLVLEARKVGGKITSARLQSRKAWKYGYFEVEASVPPGTGTWPAIWMLNDRLRHPGEKGYVDWPKCGEIDMMENVGYDPTKFHFSLHSQNFNWMKPKQRTSILTNSDPSAFHKFGLDWRPDSIAFYFDGKNVYEVKPDDKSFDSWPFVDSFYMILNLAIGGAMGGPKGVDDSIFPSKFRIRSVKVYQ